MPWNRLKEGVYFLDSIGSTYYNSRHTYKAWGLILESDEIEFPELINNDLDKYLLLQGLPGRDTGIKKFGRRKLVFNFGTRVSSRWPSLVKTITDSIHGQKKVIVRDCDSSYGYIGRCYVRAYKTTRGIGKIQIEVDAEPYKYKMNETRIEFESSSSFTYSYAGKYETPANIYLQFSSYFYGDYAITCHDYNAYGKVLYKITGNIPNNQSTYAFSIDGYRKHNTAGGTYNVMYRFPYLFPGKTHYFKLDYLGTPHVELSFNDMSI